MQHAHAVRGRKRVGDPGGEFDARAERHCAGAALRDAPFGEVSFRPIGSLDEVGRLGEVPVQDPVQIVARGPRPSRSNRPSATSRRSATRPLSRTANLKTRCSPFPPVRPATHRQSRPRQLAHQDPARAVWNLVARRQLDLGRQDDRARFGLLHRHRCGESIAEAVRRADDVWPVVASALRSRATHLVRLASEMSRSGQSASRISSLVTTSPAWVSSRGKQLQRPALEVDLGPHRRSGSAPVRRTGRRRSATKGRGAAG